MSTRARPPYDRWRDVDGTHIPLGARVKQVAIAHEHGALSGRLHRAGDVLDRRGSRLVMRFDGDDKPVSVRPHLVRVLPETGPPALSTERVINQLEQLQDDCQRHGTTDE